MYIYMIHDIPYDPYSLFMTTIRIHFWANESKVTSPAGPRERCCAGGTIA
jgi:hypothetical protein